MSERAISHREPFVPGQLRREFGPIGRVLADRYFEPVRFPASAAEQFASLSARGFVVHVMRTTAWVNFLYLDWAMVRHGLPPLRAVVNLRRWVTRPFTLVASSGPFDARFQSAMAQGGSGLVFLRESAFNSARGRETREDPFPALVELARTSERPIYLVPELLLWEKWQQKVTPSLLDRVFGSPEAPGFLHSVGTFMRNFRRAQLRVGEPIDLKRVIAERPGDDTAVIARTVRSALHHHLSRETRAVFGPPRKPVDRLIEEAMRDRQFQHALAEVSAEKNKPVAALEREAVRDFNSIAARYRPSAVGLIAPLLHWVFNRIYDGIEVDEAGLERFMKAASRAPVVITPSHKSHVDYLIMSFVLWERGYTVPLVAAGANLSFFPLGPILRRAGAFFLRRSFKDDKVYTASFRAYLKKLVHDGIHHEFFPEGGRSRTGKLLQPRLGMFTWLVDAVLEGARNDLLFVPAAIDYEKVVEGGSYGAELKGADKKPEDLKALLSAPSVLTENYGRIHLTFDEPVSLAELMRERQFDPATATDEERKGLVRALGHRVMWGISRVSTVTPHALLASALLAHRRRGITGREVSDRVILLRRLVADLGAPVSRLLENAPSSPEVIGPLADAMRMFADEGFVRSTEVRGETIYQVDDERRSELAFYKNTLINLLAGRTIVCAALLASGPSPTVDTVREQALFLSRLFKLEFLYPVGLSFEHIFDETLSHLVRLGLAVVEDGHAQVAPEQHSRDEVRFLADLLRDLIESYALVARTAAEASGLDKKAFVKRALETGRGEYLAGTLTAAEAISRPTLETALSNFLEAGYLTSGADKRLGPGALPLAEVVERLQPHLQEAR